MKNISNDVAVSFCNQSSEVVFTEFYSRFDLVDWNDYRVFLDQQLTELKDQGKEVTHWKISQSDSRKLKKHIATKK